jgi:hypothetical protein
MTALWRWIRENHEGLQTIVTFAGVLAAVWFAVLTRRLARTAGVQAEASLRGSSAAADQAKAAADQAKITQSIFEAAHRPYVEIAIDTWSYVYRDDHFRLGFSLKNHGQVPATLIGWSVVVAANGNIVAQR